MPENEEKKDPAVEPDATPDATPAAAPHATPAAAPDAGPDVEPVETEPQPTPEPQPAPAPTASANRPLPAWATNRTAIAVASAVGVFLVGGLSGFAIGQATADDGRGEVRFSPVDFRDGGGPGFRGERPDFRPPFGELPPGAEGDSESDSGSAS